MFEDFTDCTPPPSKTPADDRDFLYVSTHDFKTYFSKYLRMLQGGRYQGVIVTSYGRPVGAFIADGKD